MVSFRCRAPKGAGEKSSIHMDKISPYGEMTVFV